jgi:dTDP-4-dehydrorhamnose reductase
MKKTVMIFGISSFIGSNLIESLKDEFRIIGTYYKTPVTIPGVTSLHCDVLRKEYVSSLVALFRPNVIIYAVGLHSLSTSEKYPKLCEALNTTGAVNCATASDRFSSKFIFFSSGFIFSGEDQDIRESETPFPNTTYGKTLSSTEFYIQRSCLNYAILRCSTLYGRAYSRPSVNWFENLQLSLMNGESTLVDDNIYTGFLDTHTVGNAVKMIIRENISNRLLNLSTKDHLTRFQFAKMYAKVFKKDSSLLQPTNGKFPGLNDEDQEEKKELFFKLDCTSFEELTGVALPNVEQSLHLTLKNWKQLTR